MKLTKQRS